MLCGNEPTLKKKDTIKLEMGIPDGAGGKNTAFLETDEAMEPGVGPL